MTNLFKHFLSFKSQEKYPFHPEYFSIFQEVRAFYNHNMLSPTGSQPCCHAIGWVFLIYYGWVEPECFKFGRFGHLGTFAWIYMMRYPLENAQVWTQILFMLNITYLEGNFMQHFPEFYRWNKLEVFPICIMSVLKMSGILKHSIFWVFSIGMLNLRLLLLPESCRLF